MFELIRQTQSLMMADAFGACDAMANRRVTIKDGEISGGRDLWNDPVPGTIDTSIAISTELQPSSPSMCS